MDIRPIDGNALVASLSKLREAYMNLYDQLRKGSYEKVLYYGKFTAINETIIDIEHDAPTIDYAPVVHSEWIEPDYGYIGAKQYICKNCKDDPFWVLRCIHYQEKYCPNCGAKMDGGTKNG